jgi:hypothetical protein
MATKTGDKLWEPDPRILAIHVSSFGILSTTDGVVLAASIDAVNATSLGVTPPLVRETVVLASQDLTTWSSQLYRLMVEDEVLATDTSFYLDNRGELQLVYYRFLRDENDHSGMIPTGPHPIATASWAGGCFEENSVVYTSDDLLDPTICPYPGMQSWWLFATTSQLKIEGATGTSQDSFSKVFTWENISVPFCREEDGELALYGQRPDGLLPVTRTIVNEDGSLGLEEPIYDESNAPFANCTTPVLMRKDGTDILFCAVWTGGG